MTFSGVQSVGQARCPLQDEDKLPRLAPLMKKEAQNLCASGFGSQYIPTTVGILF